MFVKDFALKNVFFNMIILAVILFVVQNVKCEKFLGAVGSVSLE